MPVNNTTQRRSYPEPFVSQTPGVESNQQTYDVARLISALRMIDTDVYNILLSLAQKAALGHGHEISDIANLTSALQGKAAFNHTHALDDLNDVDVQAAQVGQFIVKTLNGWASGKPGVNDVTGLATILATFASNANPTFTGTPRAPTPPSSAGSTEIVNAEWVNARVTALVNSAPAVLDTFYEFANAIANDPNFATTMATQLATKANKAGDTFTGPIAVQGAIYSALTGRGSVSLAHSSIAGAPGNVQFQLGDGTPVGFIGFSLSSETIALAGQNGWTYRFDHRPSFNGNTPWDSGNLNPLSYLARTGGTMTGAINVLDADGTSAFTHLTFGKTLKQSWSFVTYSFGQLALRQFDAQGAWVRDALYIEGGANGNALLTLGSGALFINGNTAWHAGNFGRPQSAGGLGQITALFSGYSQPLYAPAGGTWFCVYRAVHQSGIVGSTDAAQVVPGGQLLAGDATDYYWTGFAWRIA